MYRLVPCALRKRTPNLRYCTITGCFASNHNRVTLDLAFNGTVWRSTVECIYYTNYRLKMESTRLYLLYYNEDITEYLSDPRIIPIYLNPQTPYMESEGFRLIDPTTIPDSVTHVGCITASYLRKTGKTLADITPSEIPNTLKPLNPILQPCYMNYIAFAQWAHPYFATLWTWLASKLEYDIFSSPAPHWHVYSNMWIMEKHHFCAFIEFSRKCMTLLDTAPNEIQVLLYQNSTYQGKLPTEECVRIFKCPYYTYHPFLAERLIILYCTMHGITVV